MRTIGLLVLFLSIILGSAHIPTLQAILVACVGSGILLLAVAWALFQGPWYAVELCSAAREVQVYRNPKGKTVDDIINAINQAMIAHGAKPNSEYLLRVDAREGLRPLKWRSAGASVREPAFCRQLAERHDLNLIINAVYLVEMCDRFLSKLLEVVRGQAASQDQHPIQIITRNALESEIWVAA